MQPVRHLSPQSSVATGSTLERMKELIKAATDEPNIAKKRAACEECYRLLKTEAKAGPLSPELKLQLYTLLDTFAYQTCYAQTVPGDNEQGFRKSACILEMAAILQLYEVGFATICPDWAEFESLERLAESLQYALGQAGKYFPAFMQLNFDPAMVCAKAKERGMREVLSSTFMHLSYSYQNIDQMTCLTGPFPSFKFHLGLHGITLGIIGDEKKLMADYRYNHDRFLVTLVQGTPQRQLECYVEVEALVREAFEPASFDHDSRLAQIENMRGIIKRQLAKDIAGAKPHFDEAYRLRSSHTETFLGRYLLTNLRTSLISYSIERGDVRETAMHRDAIQAFVDELRVIDNSHVYLPDYLKALETANNWLALQSK